MVQKHSPARLLLMPLAPSMRSSQLGRIAMVIYARSKNINAAAYRTDKQGTITAVSEGKKITLETTKQLK